MQVPAGIERRTLIVGAAQALAAIAAIFYTATMSPSTADQLIVSGHAIFIAAAMTLWLVGSDWMSQTEIRTWGRWAACLAYAIPVASASKALEPLVTSAHLHLQVHLGLAQALLVGTMLLGITCERHAADRRDPLTVSD